MRISRKCLSFFALFLLSIFLLTGCSFDGKSANNANNAGKNQFDRNRMPDFGQPERRADVTGIVKSIVGNEVTIIKLGRPEDGKNLQENGENTGNNEENQERTPAMSFGNGVGRMPGTVRMNRTGERGEMDEESRTKMLEMLKEVSTGEETVVIPVGIQMLKFSSSENSKPEMIEATLEDVTVDKMISVWLDENIADRNIASFVTINR